MLVVEDVGQSIHFYRDVLGMRISDFVQTSRMAPAGSASPRMAFFHCNPRHHSVAFLAASIKPRLRHFMLQTQSLDDVGSTYTLCQDQGSADQPHHGAAHQRPHGVVLHGFAVRL